MLVVHNVVQQHSNHPSVNNGFVNGLKLDARRYNNNDTSASPMITSTTPATTLSTIQKSSSSSLLFGNISVAQNDGFELPPLYESETSIIENHTSPFIPTFYSLRIKADPAKPRFSGQLLISLNLTKGGFSSIRLHAAETIAIKSALFIFQDESSIKATKVGRDIESEIVRIDFSPFVINAQAGYLLIVYNGIVSTEPHGLYQFRRYPLSSDNHTQHTGNNGNIDYGLATHFQPNDARRAFPCWDEPHLKARFKIQLLLPVRGLLAISNMPIKSIYKSLSPSTGEPLQEIEFYPTPLMSTYLVAIVVGQFDYIESTTVSGCRVRVYVQHSQRKDQAKFALNVAVKSLEYYEKLFGIKYPLAKFDLISLRDFGSGAMENWGAVIYQENYLLTDESTASLRSKQWIALVTAHELAHQWFGNLVTLKNWSHLWLNEGFAEFMMFACVEKIFPEYKIWHMFVTEVLQVAMDSDASVTSHPIEVSISNTHSILEIFDPISYNKGAALIRMLYNYIKSSDFDRGLRHYLAKYSYNNTVTEDLWNSFEEATGKQVSAMMRVWTKFHGYPLLSVRMIERDQYYSISIKQQRFGKDPSDIDQRQRRSTEQKQRSRQQPLTRPAQSRMGTRSVSGSHQQSIEEDMPISYQINDDVDDVHVSVSTSKFTESPIWSIPITLISENLGTDKNLKVTQNFLLSSPNVTIILPKSTIGHWFKLNYQIVGYYRVDYVDPVLMDELAKAMRTRKLHTLDRLNLQDDFFALLKIGRKSTVAYLQFLKNYQDETEFIIWSSILDSLRTVRSLLSGTEVEGPFNTYARDLLNTIYSKIGWTGWPTTNSTTSYASSSLAQLDMQNLQQLRALIIKHRILFNDTQATKQAKEFFVHKSGERIDGSLKSSIYRAMIADATDERFNEFIDAYNRSDSAYERSSICSALAYPVHDERQRRLLDMILQGDLRLQDATSVFQSIGASREGRYLAWDYFKQHLSPLRVKGLVGHMVKSISYGFSDHAIADEMERLFAENPEPEDEKQIEQSIETIRTNADWIARDGASLASYFQLV
ncbi:Puromycin-sensitive aminopeptidase [Fragariocoptes setiger]|uniref:Puromycin-sensitive aminopeptidase n=1 Tax=Fragariocoptes setiger TaxID=1670756 RepID=A0ABQ7SC97_9ACAR|nr:Puromycin-sensitive aminopeptidase [Fragariocoptes setiger]